MCCRNNIPLFIEFALLKNQVGKKDDALKILQKLIDSQSVLLNNQPVYLNITYRAPYTAIYKNVVEILIQSECKYVISSQHFIFINCVIINNNCFGFREKALLTLIALATGVLPQQASLNLTEKAMLIFDNVTESILNEKEQFAYSDLKYNYLPQFLIEWVVCRAWFLYLTQNVQDSVSMLKDIIRKIQNIITTEDYPKNQ